MLATAVSTPATVRTKRFLVCPFCAVTEFAIEHLFEDDVAHAGPWFCHDCGRSFLVEIRDGQAWTTPWKERQRKVKILLEIPPQAVPILLTIGSIECDDGTGFDAPDVAAGHHRYFYEEHTCPKNWFRDVEHVRLGADDDPHGLARFIAASHATVDAGAMSTAIVVLP